jgi:phthalate 4,5-cis-dihydrodiol dehydrogenase
VRLLGGGRVKSVRATTGQWFPGRNRDVPGYYSAFMEFEEGHTANIIHNGYGYFSTHDFLAGAGRRIGPDVLSLRKELLGGVSDETEAKNQRRFGGREESGTQTIQVQQDAPGTVRWHGFQGDLGIVIVSCERGDIRQSPGWSLHLRR